MTKIADLGIMTDICAGLDCNEIIYDCITRNVNVLTKNTTVSDNCIPADQYCVVDDVYENATFLKDDVDIMGFPFRIPQGTSKNIVLLWHIPFHAFYDGWIAGHPIQCIRLVIKKPFDLKFGSIADAMGKHIEYFPSKAAGTNNQELLHGNAIKAVILSISSDVNS